MTVEFAIDDRPRRRWSFAKIRVPNATTASVVGNYAVSSLSGFNARQHFLTMAYQISSHALRPEQDRVDAEQALARLDARKDEDIDTWALQLAEDLSHFRD